MKIAIIVLQALIYNIFYSMLSIIYEKITNDRSLFGDILYLLSVSLWVVIKVEQIDKSDIPS